ncbi:MAG: hypothetical protein ACFCUM_14525 [Bacteroidales bacterium]
MIGTKHILIASSTLLNINLSGLSSGQVNDLPNILRITSDDNIVCRAAMVIKMHPCT